MRKKIEKNFWDMEIIGNRRKIYFESKWKPHDDYMISLQSVNITGFPHNRENLKRPRNALQTFAVWVYWENPDLKWIFLLLWIQNA